MTIGAPRWLIRDGTLRGRRLPSALDGLVALGVLAIGFAEAASGAFPGPPGLAAAVQLVSLGAVAFRRVAPLPAIAISAAVYLPHVVAYGSPGSLAQLLAGLLLLHAIGRHADDRDTLAGAAIGLLLVVVQGLRGALASPADWTFALVLSGVAVGIGMAQRRQADAAAQLAAAAEMARRRQAEVTAAAVADERARIARELHDVVAHNVGLVVLQAGGARSVLSSDRERAREALERIESTGRQALAEMRQLVGILRHEDGAARAPLPRLDDLAPLVDELRSTGMRVEMAREGDAPGLPLGVQVAAYRIVQEALTNVRKHAPDATAKVVVSERADVVTLAVTNDGAGPASHSAADEPGHGLVGMRERVRLYGGTFEAGPTPDGGFRVMATLPCAAGGP
ncbi:MAG TPA: sensor histidine kinase [Candidatus Limnocylindria bacterium]|nr:sensor histidine kinase [Candidatus Limnocylindria bacterium]